METLTQPTLLLKPFAENGDKNQIPLNNETILQPQLADLTVGFPPITSKDPNDGGLPPERKDFNALGYLTTSYDFFYQAGGTFTFNSTISNAIGGYPLGARLWYTNSDGLSCILRSTIANNTNDFTQDDSVIGDTGSGKPWEVENFRGISNRGTLFDCKWADHILNDMSWLRADTFSWQDGTVYTNAYQHLVNDLGNLTTTNYYAWGIVDSGLYDIYYTISATPNVGDIVYSIDEYGVGPNGTVTEVIDSENIKISGETKTANRDDGEDVTVSTYSNAIEHTETIGSYTITYYLSSDGHKIILPDMEPTASNIYSQSGVAWYYILDTTNQRFKLPRTKFGFTGLRDSVGKYVEAGLPDHDHQVTTIYPSGFLGEGTAYRQWYDTTNHTYTTNKASNSNSIYGKSTTVQPPATQMYLYFYVGQFTQSATEQTAGLNTELFNGKVDLDAGNINTTGKYNILTYALANLQESDASKIGYLFEFIGDNLTIAAPSGGKWMVLNCYYINNSTAVMYRYLDDAYMPGNIVPGGTQILRARSGLQSVVALIRVE